MAKLSHCGLESKASSYRIASTKPAYRFQHVKHCLKCKVCGKELMEWRGEYQDPEKFTDWITIPQSEYPHWLRRIATEQAKPEAQMMSEYSQQASRPADVVGPYLLKLTQAHRWYKGNKR